MDQPHVCMPQVLRRFSITYSSSLIDNTYKYQLSCCMTYTRRQHIKGGA
jgi:hypothetical protein